MLPTQLCLIKSLILNDLLRIQTQRKDCIFRLLRWNHPGCQGLRARFYHATEGCSDEAALSSSSRETGWTLSALSLWASSSLFPPLMAASYDYYTSFPSPLISCTVPTPSTHSHIYPYFVSFLQEDLLTLKAG